MAKIKTREVDRTSIKTMNRSVSASHRIRNAGAEIRQNVRQQNDVQEQSVSEYSTARVEEGMQKTAWKAEHAAEVGIAKTSKYAKQKLQERRSRKNEMQYADTPYKESIVSNGPRKTQNGYQYQVRGHSRGEMKESPRTSLRVGTVYEKKPMKIKGNTKPDYEGMGVKVKKPIKNRREVPGTHAVRVSGNQVYAKHQKAMRNVSKTSYQMAKSGTGIVRRLTEGISNAAKTTFLGAKSFILAAAGGSAIAVVIIVICCFLGCVMYLSDDGESGDYTPMIVTVAESQLGNEGGGAFWSWYGFEERVDWCAIFVSWCGEQCGYLDAEILPKFAVVGDGAEWFKAKRQWKSGRYTPKAGDIVFFDWEEDGTMDHVGIVEKYENRTIHTIEGNSGDVCRKLQYEVRSKKICGYGVPVYGSWVEAEQDRENGEQGGE